MATKQTRWKCPLCDSGVLAPSRPRMDDVRRYCLKCSGKTGKLVQRVAPALERQRAEAKDKAKEKATAKRAKVQASKTAHCGFDIEKEAVRLWKILCKQHNSHRRLPAIKVVKRKRSGSSGYCYYGRHYISFQVGTNTIDAWETLAHELVHAIGHRGHGPDFYKALKAVTEARWRITVSSYNWTRPGYACDWDLRLQLTEKQAVVF